MVAGFRVAGSGTSIFSIPKEDHKCYMKKLGAVIDGSVDDSQWKSVDYRHCRFGRWYYSDASRAYSSMPSFKDVEEPHLAVHRAANDAVRAISSGNQQRARQLLSEAETASKNVIAALAHVESEVETMAAR